MTAPVPPAGRPPADQGQVCSWHPDRPTGLACTRCNRPACAECLTPASVGFHCRACVAEARGAYRPARTISGSVLGQKPVVTWALIAVNVAVFALTAAQAGSGLDIGVRSEVFAQGALVPELVSGGEYWRLLTSGFLHFGLIHLASNMLSLYFLGLPLERAIGRERFGVIYLLSLLGGSATVMLFSERDALTAGASGAIFGLMGALVVTFRRMRMDLRQLVFVVAINLFITFRIPGISWQAHLGGLVVGALVGALMVYSPPARRRAWQVGGSVAIGLVLLAVIGVNAALNPATFCGLAGPYFVPCGS